MEHEILSSTSFSHLQCPLKSKGYLKLKDIFDAHLSHSYWYHMAIRQFCNSFLFASMQINFAQAKSQSIKASRTEALEKLAYSSCHCWERGGEAEMGSVAIRRHHPHPQPRHCNPGSCSALCIYTAFYICMEQGCVCFRWQGLNLVKNFYCLPPKLLLLLIATAP